MEDRSVSIPMELLLKILDVMGELRDEVVAQAEHQYPAELRKVYPSYRRRYERDTEVVHRADAILIDLRTRDA